MLFHIYIAIVTHLKVSAVPKTHAKDHESFNGPTEGLRAGTFILFLGLTFLVDDELCI